MLKYLRDKLFFDLGPTATTDLSRPLRHDFVTAVFTRHATCRATYVACRALLYNPIINYYNYISLNIVILVLLVFDLSYYFLHLVIS